MIARSGIFRHMGFSKGPDTQNHSYQNENLFRSIDMICILQYLFVMLPAYIFSEEFGMQNFRSLYPGSNTLDSGCESLQASGL